MSPAVLVSLMCFASAHAQAQDRLPTGESTAGAEGTADVRGPAAPPAAAPRGETSFTPPHAMCPVMPEEPSEEDFHLVYKGRDVHFCCSTCIQYFRKDPKKYLDRLPHFEGWRKEDPIQAEGGDGDAATAGTGPPALGEVWMGSLIQADLVPAFALLLPLFAAFLAWRRKRLGPEAFRRVVRLHTAWFLFFATTVVATSFGRHAYAMYNLWKDRDRVHFATFFEFGHPPVPERPQDQPKSLSSRYYRGNDERNPALFNNGYYRTATFDLRLEDASGQPIRAGQDLAGKQLFIHLRTQRAPHTAERFFHREAMETIFLTRVGDPMLGVFEPIPDRVEWTEIKEGWTWEARYPIGRVAPERRTSQRVDLQTASASEIASLPGVTDTAARWLVKYRDWNEGIQSTADLVEAGIEGPPLHALSKALDSEVFQGVVYVAQLIPKGDDLTDVRGSRFHFGVVFDVRLRGGQIVPDSDLWMNYLYRSRKTAAWRIPTTEWFDNKPIPELPGEGTQDPLLLGLSDDDQGLIPGAQ